MRSATKDRGRFAYMGARGGPLWQRIRVSSNSHAGSPQLSGSNPAVQTQAAQQHSGAGSAAAPAVFMEDVQGRQHMQVLDHSREALGPTAKHPFWPWLDAWLRNRCLHASPELEQLPFDFWGGLVGFLGYGLKDAQPPLASVPDAGLVFADR